MFPHSFSSFTSKNYFATVILTFWFAVMVLARLDRPRLSWKLLSCKILRKVQTILLLTCPALFMCFLRSFFLFLVKDNNKGRGLRTSNCWHVCVSVWEWSHVHFTTVSVDIFLPLYVFYFLRFLKSVSNFSFFFFCICKLSALCARRVAVNLFGQEIFTSSALKVLRL